MIEIVSPGILSSVQDLGRPGYLNMGVGATGAMDPVAMRVANMLVGNNEDSAVIETTLGGLEIRFLKSSCVAVTGADCKAEINSRPISNWWSYNVTAGQILKMRSPELGLRSYVAASGGIDVPKVMGARSTDLKGLFGGFEGRPLRAGDLLKCLTPAPNHYATGHFGISLRKASFLCEYKPITTVRVIPAAEWHNYNKEHQSTFLGNDWLVSPDSNRMGYRLEGPTIEPEEKLELLSHGILPGTIQLPPSGQPIIQLNDANTCGGYPKMAAVIQADLYKLAQVRPGDKIRFCLTTRRKALKSDLNLMKALKEMNRQIDITRRVRRECI